jgi:hypothetical protein
MPPRLTFDTSCSLNLHTGEPDPAVVQLINWGVSGRVLISVAPTAVEEVQRATDPQVRSLSVTRLGMFPVIQLGPKQATERERLRDQLMADVFPKSVSGSTTWEHNRRDCEHIAAHILGHGDLFVTLDAELLKKADAAKPFGAELASPSGALALLGQKLGPPPELPTGLAIRDYEPDDEADVRRVLAAIGEDYPSFDSWLTDQLSGTAGARITVGIAGGNVAAVAIWKRRGSDRVVKLSAFRVDESARQNALGPHLLWHLIRAWVAMGVELTYVTLSSRHAELVSFFAGAGFLVQGVTPERYLEGASEIVMGKHFLRREVTDDDFAQLGADLADRYFGVPVSESSVGINTDAWLLTPFTLRPRVEADPRLGRLRFLSAEGQLLRELDAIDIERLFHPIRLLLSHRRALMVPIQPTWAQRMMRYPSTQLELFSEATPDRLLLRTDNAYYCTPRCEELLALGVPIIFYVSAPEKACVAEARVLDYAVDTPERLVARYGDLGVYSLDNIRTHVPTHGQYEGRALGLHFGLYVPFRDPVTLRVLRAIRKTTNPQPQGLSSIDLPTYHAIRQAGGLHW